MKRLKIMAEMVVVIGIMFFMSGIVMALTDSQVQQMHKRLEELKRQLAIVQASNSYSKELAIMRLKAEIEDIERQLAQLNKRKLFLDSIQRDFNIDDAVIIKENALAETYREYLKASGKSLAKAEALREKVKKLRKEINKILKNSGSAVGEEVVFLKVLRNTEAMNLKVYRSACDSLNFEKEFEILKQDDARVTLKVISRIVKSLKGDLGYVREFVKYIDENGNPVFYKDILKKIIEGLNYMKITGHKNYDEKLHIMVNEMLIA